MAFYSKNFMILACTVLRGLKSVTDTHTDRQMPRW